MLVAYKSYGNTYYPTALKGCRVIVVTHGVRMGWLGVRAVGQVGCRKEFVRAVFQKELGVGS